MFLPNVVIRKTGGMLLSSRVPEPDRRVLVSNWDLPDAHGSPLVVESLDELGAVAGRFCIETTAIGSGIRFARRDYLTVWL
jgi:hypothetical protein